MKRRRRTRRLAGAIDERVHLARPVRRGLNRVFPDHWSFALGEMALYLFVVLILTGTYLTFFYQPSDHEVVYHGRYVPLRDVPMSEAFSSTLRISFDVRGGLLIRQMHHWATLLLFAVLVLHLARCFFTGAFRRPRDVNWFIGATIYVVALLEGYCGYVLPDDVLSGASMTIARSVVQSIPVVGTWLVFMICGGEYPGPMLIIRLYVAHVLLLPALLVVLIGAHLALVVRQRHTVPPSAAASEARITGPRAYPVYFAQAGGRFAIAAAIVAALAGLAQINPIWLYGPYTPAAVTAESQSDWYLFFLEGALRLWPPWEIRAAGHTVPAVFFPGVLLPALIYVATAFYPWFERWLTGDRARHHVLQRPRDAPVRTAVGAAAITFWVILELASTDDVITHVFHLAIEPVRYAFRVLLFAMPALALVIAYGTCRRLARSEGVPRERGPGRFVRLPSGDWGEVVSDGAPAPADRSKAGAE